MRRQAYLGAHKVGGLDITKHNISRVQGCQGVQHTAHGCGCLVLAQHTLRNNRSTIDV
jgi:hypothetical protein